MWYWDEYSSESGVPDTPLLLSSRSQQLVLSALKSMQYRWLWDEFTDDVDSAVSDALNEIMSVSMPDFTPVGTILAYAGVFASIPEKWQICDGHLLLADDYPELRDVLDVPFDDNTYLTVPDLRSRFIYGAEFNSDLGDIGGAATHALTIAEMPAHTHTVPMRNASAGTGAIPVRASGNANEANATSGSQGTGAAHNNMPPYMKLFYIIKVLP